jgi:D-alanyl-D-alanine-carboxypeptidase/D-alanyl-D-alanine-endopeptidase
LIYNQPQDYLPYWTTDPTDSRRQITLEQLLAFTSGFNNPPAQAGCVADGTATLQDCVESIYNGGLDSQPGSSFAYGPEHLHIAAAMVEVASGQSFSQLFAQSIQAGLNLSQNTRLVAPSSQNPRASGGGESSVDDYVKILQELLRGNALADTSAFYADQTAAPVTFTFRPNGIGTDWHYAQGAWRPCEQLVWDLSCEDKVIVSSPGAFGWTPWIDVTNGYYGLIAMDESIFTSPSERSVDLMMELLPLVEAQIAP